MLRTFRAKKMIDRIEKNPELVKYLDSETREFILSLDGKQGNDYNWMSVVRDEPLVWIELEGHKDGGVYVNEADCD